MAKHAKAIPVQKGCLARTWGSPPGLVSALFLLTSVGKYVYYTGSIAKCRMPLRKLLTMTPSPLEVHRPNAQESTGPRAARGKAQSRMTGLKNGRLSSLAGQLLAAPLNAQLGASCAAARVCLASAIRPEVGNNPRRGFAGPRIRPDGERKNEGLNF